ncbi:ubiquitin-protein ligase, PUB13 [Selaginella moellendorffii]|uniref:RING-type E3 ubiquitin transferase n=1 Tax=Selaginella moellendorffii TaxID=88036 RepID=D8SS28_SELML|nr:U-box domain-containing protein 13 [Selaginella moellendorffii]EFJ12670.1 ubiquitin-protein ligase, PUB13 [Selaginella moellendorffii]|eukprot:XP_002986139.1 U-box domain-containing protein 13 [Selaginella moellendorffii]
MAGQGEFQELVETLIGLLNEISSLGDYARSHRKECTNLARRLKLLAPLLEEAREASSLDSLRPFHDLKLVLHSAKDLLSLCHKGSKIFLIMKREGIASSFQSVTADLEHVLDSLPYNSLNLSEEVREQVELLHAQLKRAKGKAEVIDTELIEDLMRCSTSDERDYDRMAAERLADKLHLKTWSEIKEEEFRAQESLKLDKGGDLDAAIKMVLGRLKGIAISDADEPYVSIDKARVDFAMRNPLSPSPRSDKLSNPAIPEDFRCPISLELMKDPVIVATGQTYERSYIQKWLDAGHKTCPITQQTLPHLVLTPNYVLRSLICQWCETNGIELPKKVGTSRGGHSSDLEACGDRVAVEALLQKLSSPQVDVQRIAVADLRLLAKRSIDNRICIAEAGGVPLLIGLLSSTDTRIQEHAVTALLNLSIHDPNKAQIVQAGAINPIVEVLKSGSMEARENAAATLFSLSVVDDNKVTIGQTAAIPALVNLLREGTPRGKKDAATALFNLSIYQGNKAKAVRAGVVPPLMELLDPNAGMVDEALAILAILATHQEGRVAIGQESTIPLLVELIRSGSARNKENAAAVLLALGQNDAAHLVTAQQYDAGVPLAELVQNGTSRARRKASLILELMHKQQQEQLNKQQ